MSSQQGRRIPKEFCCEIPVADEMAIVIQRDCGLRVMIERGKSHPRNSTGRQGLVRVQIKNTKGGTPCNPQYPNKISILKKCGQVIPSLDLRKERLKKIKQAEEEREKHFKQIGGTGTTTTTKKKKKGKR